MSGSTITLVPTSGKSGRAFSAIRPTIWLPGISG
jgi:hypothetical protein